MFNMEPKPLKTFRTEFSIYEQSSSTTYVPSPDRYVGLLLFILLICRIFFHVYDVYFRIVCFGEVIVLLSQQYF